MLKNNLKIAFRHLIKDKYISAINFIGLVVGMVAVLFIWQYVAFERSYDKIHEQGDRIFRVQTDRVKNGVPFMQFASGAACAGPVIAQNFPEVENYVKLVESQKALYTYQDKVTFQPKKVYFAMPSLLDIFSFSLLEGNPETFLNEPFTASISESTAKSMFGEENPIGKIITRNGLNDYTITSVINDAPLNSHLKFDILLSYVTYSDVFIGNGSSETAPYWDGFLTYLLLKPNTDWKALESKFPDMLERTYDKETREGMVFYLQPFEAIHLSSNLLNETETPGDGNAVQFLLIIGSLVLIIAWFNYINLSTARSELRAKEVGVRKVIGSTRASLIQQFMTEAVLINSAAIVIAFLLAQLLKPWFIDLVEKPIPLDIWDNWSVLATILAVFFIGTFLTGLYPAFLLSSFKPISVLKGGGSFRLRSAGSGWLRKGLLVFQFIASIGLIASTIIIYNQLNFMQNKKLGVDIDQTLVIKSPIATDSLYSQKAKTFKKQLQNIPIVKSVSGSTSVPGQPFGMTAGVSRWGTEEGALGFHAFAADFNFTDVYDIEVIAGRALSEKQKSDVNSCILNIKASEVFEFENPENALGLEIDFWGDRFKVVGVVSNYHNESPKSEIEPMILRPINERFTPDYFSLKLNTSEISQSIASIEKTWAQIFPGNPLEYFFLDDHYNQQYNAEKLFGKIFSLFSGLAIFVSCLGLFALIAFQAERKKKEISIRKVLGASVASIIGLLSRDFIRLVFLALIITIPLSWYFMNNWLAGFAERISIQWWVFALAGLLTVGIAFLTMSFQSIKAALASPVDSLGS